LAERRRDGYLDRLVDTASIRGRSTHSVHAPHQIVWGPERPVVERDEVEGLRPREEARRAARRAPRDASPTPEPAAPTADRALPARAAAFNEPSPHASSFRAPRRVDAPAPSPVEPAPARPTELPAAAERERVIREPRRVPTVVQPPTPNRTIPVAVAAPPEVALPDAVQRAMERLSALSLPVRQEPARAHERAHAAASPEPAAPARAPEPATVVVPARAPRRETPSEPRVHIGSIEVTVAPPPVPPAPAPPPLPPMAPAPVPTSATVTRISRPSELFGLGQG
jgi:hypothetical protein